MPIAVVATAQLKGLIVDGIKAGLWDGCRKESGNSLRMCQADHKKHRVS